MALSPLIGRRSVFCVGWPPRSLSRGSTVLRCLSEEGLSKERPSALRLSLAAGLPLRRLSLELLRGTESRLCDARLAGLRLRGAPGRLSLARLTGDRLRCAERRLSGARFSGELRGRLRSCGLARLSDGPLSRSTDLLRTWVRRSRSVDLPLWARPGEGLLRIL